VEESELAYATVKLRKLSYFSCTVSIAQFEKQSMMAVKFGEDLGLARGLSLVFTHFAAQDGTGSLIEF
jgi:hypothetical protein